ncbi:MAG TPA: hypothetical protein VK843_02365 [Planctomycetota bacterium]|nr:hypothetical protein [Planctomycetota bacterium]
MATEEEEFNWIGELRSYLIWTVAALAVVAVLYWFFGRVTYLVTHIS